MWSLLFKNTEVSDGWPVMRAFAGTMRALALALTSTSDVELCGTHLQLGRSGLFPGRRDTVWANLFEAQQAYVMCLNDFAVVSASTLTDIYAPLIFSVIGPVLCLFLALTSTPSQLGTAVCSIKLTSAKNTDILLLLKIFIRFLSYGRTLSDADVFSSFLCPP